MFAQVDGLMGDPVLPAALVARFTAAASDGTYLGLLATALGALSGAPSVSGRARRTECLLCNASHRTRAVCAGYKCESYIKSGREKAAVLCFLFAFCPSQTSSRA